MLSSILAKDKNFTQEDLIEELFNSNSSSERLDLIYNSLKIDLNSLEIDEEPILHLCCKKDIFESVSWLLSKKVDIYKQNAQKETAAFYAIYSRNSAILQLLVDYGTNINHLNISNRSILQEALNSANGSVIRYLLQTTTMFNNIDVHGNNLLFDAVLNPNENTLKHLASLKQIDINHINKAGNTILHLRNILENNNLAQLLISLGANPTIPNKKGESLLFYLVQKGESSIKLIKYISSMKFDFNLKNSSNRTILMEAVATFLQISDKNEDKKAGQYRLILELMNLNIDINIKDSKEETAFFYALRSENKDLILEFFKNFKIDLNEDNSEGISPFLHLILGGIRNKELIKPFLDKGANPNLKNINKKSVVEILIDIILHIENNQKLDDNYRKHIQLNGQYRTILEIIFRYFSIDVNALNYKNEPLFFSSILNFNFKLFAILKTRTIKLNQKDKSGNNIIFRLLDENNKDLIKDKKLYLNTIRTLVNAGIDIDEKNSDGFTPLHIAITQKCEDTIKLILNLQADFFARDKNGRNIMHLIVLNNASKYFNFIHNINKGIVEVADIYGVKPINYAAFMGKYELVLAMINENISIENSERIHPNILKFLSRYHLNLLSLSQKAKNEMDKKKIEDLILNMKKEFKIAQ
ncbi:ankyrin repeat domain-containing protein [Arcobacter vandammei]|uniref:ankyrin repeat domain-containing protein n=1 Tax=Arcobacter vandammei TaxID=2782243 RepID=UPI0018DF29CE|nr:ankyrin repeat domain-containing protein [Arcobacter vandammei]